MIWVLLLIIAFIFGYAIGRFNEAPTQEIVEHKPSREEVLIVLRTIKSSLNLSPYENNCFEEAYKIIESTSDEEEE